METTSASTLKSTSSTVESAEVVFSASHISGITLQVVFGVIAFLSLVGNLLFCVVLLRKRSMLKQPYNVLLLVLAVTDMLTGVAVPLTPGFMIPVNEFPYPDGVGGDIFCHVIDTKFLIFTLSKASLLLVMCLAIERWFSFIKPLQYKLRFSNKRLVFYISAIWLTTCIFQSYRLFSKTVDTNGCRWTTSPFGQHGLVIMTVSYVFATFVFPSVITWASFFHIWLRVRKSPAMNTVRGDRAKFRLLRMCALIALCLTLCWLPDQLYFVLYVFGVTSLMDPISDYFIVLGLFNSCLNPWIYCLSNKEFRKEFRRLFSCLEITRDSMSHEKSVQDAYISTASVWI